MAITFSEFRDLVRRMRQYQRAYFRGRVRHDLIRSKELEREVDLELMEPALPFAGLEEEQIRRRTQEIMDEEFVGRPAARRKARKEITE